MVKINLIADIFGASGYASHGRQLANVLYNEGADVYLECARPQGWEAMVNDAERGMLTNEYFKDGITIMIGLPHSWKIMLSNRPNKFYGFFVWEGDKIRKGWIEDILDKRVTGILVPSEHTKKAILNTVEDETIKNKVHVVPHGVDMSLFSSKEKQEGTPFTFVMNKGWRAGINDRGGVQWALKAFSEEFNQTEPVRFILKVNPVYCGPGWNIEHEVNKLELDPDRPEILIDTHLLDFKVLPMLYQQGDCCVAPTMSDGFNLPCAEAMACGLPVITTNFGGQTDYVTENNGWTINGELREVDFDIMYEGVKWLWPDMSELKASMRYAYEHPEEVKAKGEQAQKDIMNFTWQESAKKLLKILG